MNKNLFSPYYIIAYDEMEVRDGYDLWNQKFVVGGERVLSIDEFVKMSETDLHTMKGTKMCLFYAISTCGKSRFPVALWIHPGDSSTDFNSDLWIITKLKDIVNKVECEEIQFIGSSSDGDLAHGEKFESEMNTWNQQRTNGHNHPWFHIFDHDHLAKSIKNAFTKRFFVDEVQLQDNTQKQRVIFTVHDLIRLVNTSTTVKIPLSSKELCPSDCMEFKAVKDLISASVCDALYKVNTVQSIAIARFLENIRFLYEVPASQHDEMSLEKKIEKL
ncbi:hypothetical protein AKO1_013301, partial [Acrasis kona]